MNLLTLESVPALQAEVRALAAERGAVILAHNYQLPEVQDVADFVGDSLGLSQQAAKTDAEVIAFCGVHFMAETASVLSPDKTVLLPDLDAGCSLADSITADQLRAWKAKHPRRARRHVRQHDRRGQGRDRLLRDVLQRRAGRRAHLRASTAPTPRSSSARTCSSAPTSRSRRGRKMHVWDGECHVHAGIRPSDISDMRAAHPGADFLIHPECGCSTSVMEYVAAGDVASDGVHMLSTGGMMAWAAAAPAGATAIMATETGMLHPLQMARPDIDFVAANEAASCRYMKMITLPKLRDTLRDMSGVVKVPEAIAERARLPIERMVAIG